MKTGDFLYLSNNKSGDELGRTLYRYDGSAWQEEKLGKGCMAVKSIVANNIDVENLSAIKAYIGGWTIGTDSNTGQLNGSLYYLPSNKSFGQDGTIFLIPAGSTASTSIGGRSGADWVITAGSHFGVTNTGALYANSGKFANWNIGANAIYRATSGTASESYDTANILYFGTSGLSLGTTFKVSSAGSLTATLGSIAGWTINSTSLYRGTGSTYGASGTQYFGTDGLSLGTTFKVSSSGSLTATSGSVGGWTLGTYSLTSTSGGLTTGIQTPASGTYAIAVGSTSSSSWGTAPFRVTHAGALTSTSGQIGPWTIASTGLYNSKTSYGSGTNGVYIGTDGIEIESSIGRLQLDPSTGVYLYDKTNTSGSYLLSVGDSTKGTDVGSGFLSMTYNNSFAIDIGISNYSGQITLFNSTDSSRYIDLDSYSRIISVSKILDTWVSAIKSPALNVVTSGSSGAAIGMTIPSKTGYIGVGTYGSSDDKLYVRYISATNYTAGTNSVSAATVDCNITGSAGSASAIIDAGNSSSITAQYSGSAITYSNYTYLAAWNGYKIVAVNKSDFLASSGGTLSDWIAIKNANITKGTAPSAEQSKHIEFTDKDGWVSTAADSISCIIGGTTAANMNYILLRSFYANTSSSANVQFGVYYPSSGDPYCKSTGEIDVLVPSGRTGIVEVTTNATTPQVVQLRVNNDSSNAAGGIYSSKSSKWLTRIDSSGTVTTNTSSDLREKNVIGEMPSEEALSLLRRMEVMNFTYKNDDNKIVHNGLIAQNLRDVMKDIGIGYRMYLGIDQKDGDKFYYDLNTPEENVRYGIDYSKLTPILWKGWRIHDSMIFSLKYEIEKLKAEIEALKKGAAQ